jgi:hypothetical protein
MAWKTRPQPPIEQGSWLPPAVIPESLTDREARLKREQETQAAIQALWDRKWQEDMEEIEREKRQKARPRRQSAEPPAERSFSKGAYCRTTETTVQVTLDRFQHEKSTARIVGEACEAWLIQRGMKLNELRWRRSGDHTAEHDSKPATGTLRGSNGHASDDGTHPPLRNLFR